MEQQQQVEDTAMLMPAEWVEQQMKSFTVWINMHLRKRNLSIEDIKTDLSDGRKFIQLLEIISGESLPSAEKKNLRLHQINNVNRCIEFIVKKGVKLTNIGSEEIVDHNLKVILGCVWCVILRFAIQSHEEIKTNDGLLLWVQKKTKGYKGVNVTNFSSSFSDGLAFNALIHSHRPDLLEYDKLGKENRNQNLHQAFDIADKHLNIPPMLDVNDMIAPDPRAVMTYISAYYSEFSKNQTVDNAARRINRALDTNAENAQKVKEYERIASELLEWINRKSDDFQSYNLDDKSLNELCDKLNDISRYRTDEKPPKAKDKATLENLASAIKTRMQLQNQPNYNPLEGHSIGDINNAWTKLGENERTLLERLLMMIRDLTQIENLLKRYYRKCEQQDSWSSTRQELVNSDVSNTTLFQLSSAKSKLVEVTNEIESREQRIQLITSMRDKLNDMKCREMNKVDERHSSINNAWGDLKKSLGSYRDRLNERERVLMEIDQKKRQFAQSASEIKAYLESVIEDLTDACVANSLTEAETLQKELDSYEQTINEKEIKINDIKQLESQISSSSDPTNYYCVITTSELETKLKDARDAGNSRRTLLSEECSTQQQNESTKLEFSKLADEIENFRVGIVQQIQSASTESTSLEDHIQRLKDYSTKVDAFYREKLPQLDGISKTMQEKKIYHNERSTHTFESINAAYQQLFDLISSSINEVESQIIVRDSGKISEQQIREYRKSFDHFDKEKVGYLNYEDFRAFLISLEFAVNENDPAGDREFNRIIPLVDHEKTFQITYQKFFDFITLDSVETDNAEQIIKAFRAVAGDKDYITPDLIKRYFPEKANDMIPRMTPSTDPNAPPGALDYRSFVASIYGESEL